MELLDNGGVPEFRHPHDKSDCCQVPSLQSRIEINYDNAQPFASLTMQAHLTCHILARETSEEGRQVKLWVPGRAFNKKFDAGKLDNTVACGITNGDTIEEQLAQAEEEAALRGDFETKNLKATGIISYFDHCSAAKAVPQTREVT